MEEECHQLDQKPWTQHHSRLTVTPSANTPLQLKRGHNSQERKAELESYTTVLRARIAQIAVHVQEPENDSLLLALEQEYTSASQKMRDAVSSFVSVMESITLKYNYRISSNKRCTSNSSRRDRELAEIVVALDLEPHINIFITNIAIPMHQIMLQSYYQRLFRGLAALLRRATKKTNT